MIDWYDLLMGILLIISGILMIVYRITRKDFQMTFGSGQWISAGIILVLFGGAMVIKSL
jgi:uncharacterized membrane protein HdeD (DUF308 family)